MLSIQSISSGYGQTLILKDIEISLSSSEYLLITGRNGVGKTTLMRTIMGLNKVMSGKIMFNSVDITFYKPHERARMGLGYVPQGRRLFPYLTVQENLLVSKSTFMNRKSRIFVSFEDMLDFIYGLFPILIKLLKKTAGSLSGGEQQIVAIARALATGPSLILLDEPFEGIQPSIVEDIIRALDGIKKKLMISVILVEHKIQNAWDLVDKVCVIDNGRKVFENYKQNTTMQNVLELISI